MINFKTCIDLQNILKLKIEKINKVILLKNQFKFKTNKTIKFYIILNNFIFKCYTISIIYIYIYIYIIIWSQCFIWYLVFNDIYFKNK